MSETDTKFENWAIVELFGHQKIAGLVSEATIGGCSFIRVDVPEHNDRPAFTKFYGSGAIYALTPVSEEIARHALGQMEPRPVQAYLLPEPEPEPEMAECEFCGMEILAKNVIYIGSHHHALCAGCAATYRTQETKDDESPF